MRIAVSGTHCMGKSTLIEDFIKRHPHYKHEDEPYNKLLEEKAMEALLEPSLEGLLEELDYSLNLLNDNANEQNIIFDRCPVDFIAYALCTLDRDSINIHESEISERFPEIQEALDHLDLIVFLPISRENSIVYTEDNPAYRKAADHYFKKIYREDMFDLLPS
jgi:hypothetical protein